MCALKSRLTQVIPGGGGVHPYKGLMGACGQPGYFFRDFFLKQGRKISDICLKQGQNMRGRAAPPYSGIYRVPPPPPGQVIPSAMLIKRFMRCSSYFWHQNVCLCVGGGGRGEGLLLPLLRRLCTFLLFYLLFCS